METKEKKGEKKIGIWTYLSILLMIAFGLMLIVDGFGYISSSAEIDPVTLSGYMMFSGFLVVVLALLLLLTMKILQKASKDYGEILEILENAEEN